MKIIIVGSVAGGATAAARLRRLDENAEIIMLERGEYISYANCGLPYYIGGVIKNRSNLVVQTVAGFSTRFNIDIRTSSDVVAVNPAEKNVTIHDLKADKTYTESYDRLILSPGGSPRELPFLPVSQRVFTLRNIPDTLKLYDFIAAKAPHTAAVIGAGFIGLEVAENLAERGLDVTVIESAPHIINNMLDSEVAAEVQNYIRSTGKLRLSTKSNIGSAAVHDSCVEIDLNGENIKYDIVVLAIGVVPDTKFIENSIKLGSRGMIDVNSSLQTDHEDIFAVGDAIESTNLITGRRVGIPLAGPANKQGRMVADNALGNTKSFDGSLGTAIIKVFDKTVAFTGITESACKAEGIDYNKTYTYPANHATYYPGATNMAIKIIWEKATGKILGAQIFGGDGVDKRIDVISTVMRLNGTIYDFTKLDLSYAPPYGSAKDPVNMLGFIAENIKAGLVKQFFWENISELYARSDVTLLDVRTTVEVLENPIDKFVNIPLDELRLHLDELPKDKPIYVTCHSGLRSYVATRILAGHGYDVYNIAGGARLYAEILKNSTAK